MKKNLLTEKILHIFCPICGARLIDGLEAIKVNLTCKRCKTKLKASFDLQVIHLEICKLPLKQQLCNSS